MESKMTTDYTARFYVENSIIGELDINASHKREATEIANKIRLFLIPTLNISKKLVFIVKEKGAFKHI